jgi:hypothetical protein
MIIKINKSLPFWIRVQKKAVIQTRGRVQIAFRGDNAHDVAILFGKLAYPTNQVKTLSGYQVVGV